MDEIVIFRHRETKQMLIGGLGYLEDFSQKYSIKIYKEKPINIERFKQDLGLILKQIYENL